MAAKYSKSKFIFQLLCLNLVYKKPLIDNFRVGLSIICHYFYCSAYT